MIGNIEAVTDHVRSSRCRVYGPRRRVGRWPCRSLSYRRSPRISILQS